MNENNYIDLINNVQKINNSENVNYYDLMKHNFYLLTGETIEINETNFNETYGIVYR